MVGEILLIIFSFALILSGAAGVLMPFLPGVPLAWLGMLAFAYATDFLFITWKALLIFLGLTLLTLVLDAIAPVLGAKKYKATTSGVVGSILGLFIGVAAFGPVGIILGPFLGTLFGEIYHGRDSEEAVRSAKGTVVGFLAGSAIKLALVLVMLGFMISAALTVIF